MSNPKHQLQRKVNLEDAISLGIKGNIVMTIIRKLRIPILRLCRAKHHARNLCVFIDWTLSFQRHLQIYVLLNKGMNMRHISRHVERTSDSTLRSASQLKLTGTPVRATTNGIRTLADYSILKDATSNARKSDKSTASDPLLSLSSSKERVTEPS